MDSKRSTQNATPPTIFKISVQNFQYKFLSLLLFFNHKIFEILIWRGFMTILRKFWPFYSKKTDFFRSLTNIKIQWVISKSIFDRFSKPWHNIDQGYGLFKMNISQAHYAFYFKIWVFEPKNLSRPIPVPISIMGKKTIKVWKTT